MEKSELSLTWDFADTCALHVRQLLPFPCSLLLCWEKPKDRTTGWWPQKMIKAPHFPACPHWLQLTDPRHPKSLWQEQRTECCSCGRGNLKQPLGTQFQYTAFKEMPGENQLFFPTEAWMCLSAAQTEWIMGTRPQAPKTESCRIFCLPVKHQQAKRSKRSLGHQLELWAADGSICLSGRTQVFPDSQGHLLQTLNLNLDVTECLRKGWCWSVLCPAGTVGDPRLHSQALPSSPLGLGQGIIWSPPVWCPPLKPGSGPASQRHSSSI